MGRWAIAARSTRAEGRARIGRLSDRDLLVAGAALYAGEGSKRDGAVQLPNTDPLLVAFFCDWLRRFFDIKSRLRVVLHLHEDLDLDEARRFWAGVTDVPLSQSTQPYRAVVDPARKTTRHVHGCATVRYSCSSTHRAVLGLVTALFAAPRDPG